MLVHRFVSGMLDLGDLISYLTGMTYYRKPHPPIYYKIRTFVRVAFWSSVVIGLTTFASWFSQLGDKPECPVILNSDFTYQKLADFDPTECTAGYNVTLLEDFRWIWTN